MPYNQRVNILKRVPRQIQTELIGSPKLTAKTLRQAASPKEDPIHKLRTADVARASSPSFELTKYKSAEAARRKEDNDLVYIEEEFKLGQFHTSIPDIQDPTNATEEDNISRPQPRTKSKKRGYIRLNLY